MSNMSQEKNPSNFHFETAGRCPICEKEVTFSSSDPWLRDHFVCHSCPGGSLPRERALMLSLRRHFPNWRDLDIHESSPGRNGASVVIKRDCRNYIESQFFIGVTPGEFVDGVRCENLESTTFPDESLDIIITQDVLEHVNMPSSVFQDCARVLRHGGAHLFTAPTYKNLDLTLRRALYKESEVEHYFSPEYHGNPIDPNGSLVTFHYAMICQI